MLGLELASMNSRLSLQKERKREHSFSREAQLETCDTAEAEAKPGLEGLRLAIEWRIEQRTWGRIRQLKVEVIDGCVIVHGCSTTYYTKQLALVAVREVAASWPVEFDIQVVPAGTDLGQAESFACATR